MASRVHDLKGQRFGRLIAVTYVPPKKGGCSKWRCKCDCGGFTTAEASSLRRGETKSCGCLRKDLFKDITGLVVGRLTVVRVEEKRGKVYFWRCRCECGQEAVVSGVSLRNGNTKSCGCAKMEVLRHRNVTHGKTGTPEHRIWSGIKNRCSNQNDKCYKYYGGRGVRVCQRWQDSFENFLEDVGYRPDPSLSLDRIDPRGDYEPGNVRWLTIQEQQRNKRNTIYVTIGGQTKPRTEWQRIAWNLLLESECYGL